MATSCDDYNDGIVTWMWGSEDGEVKPTKRYYVMGNYSRFLDSGDKRIEGYVDNADDGVFATVFKKGNGDIVVVLTNTGNKKAVINLPDGYTIEEAYETSAEMDLKKVATVNSDNAYTASSGSVTTLILSK